MGLRLTQALREGIERADDAVEIGLARRLEARQLFDRMMRERLLEMDDAPRPARERISEPASREHDESQEETKPDREPIVSISRRKAHPRHRPGGICLRLQGTCGDG